MSTVQPVIPQCTAFGETPVCRHLQAAWQGEKHLHRLYVHAAQCMEDARLYVATHAFTFTAAQCREHADCFGGLLTACGGCLPQEEAPAPLPCCPPEELLRIAFRTALASSEMYDSRCACDAREAGFPRIALAFGRIAETKQLHARRFRQYADALADGRLFRDARPVSWVCLACGQLHTDREAPAECPGCSRDQGHFIRSSFYPFAVEA